MALGRKLIDTNAPRSAHPERRRQLDRAHPAALVKSVTVALVGGGEDAVGAAAVKAANQRFVGEHLARGGVVDRLKGHAELDRKA
jgi:hypothetical protein